MDERDFIGTGWAFPMRVNGRGGLQMATQEQDVDQAILLILSTPIGQRRMRPRFGCAIHDLVFAPNGPATHGLIRHYVMDALALWEPRVEVLDVEVYPDADDPGLLVVGIDYVLRATNDRRNLVYPFYIIPGED
jgi:phage baseplate assembly protein W